MSVQRTREEVWWSMGYVDVMTATYQPECDNFIVGYVEINTDNTFLMGQYPTDNNGTKFYRSLCPFGSCH